MNLGKIFEGGMLFRTFPTTLLEIIYIIINYSEVIVESTIDADENVSRTL